VSKYGFSYCFFVGVVILAFLMGCAHGVQYKDMANTIPALTLGEGRIFFFRPAWGMYENCLPRPVIYLNDEMVGTSKCGGFFFVDRPAGNYTASAKSEVENTASFVLEAGETKYLRALPHPGRFLVRIGFSLETSEKALAELPSLHYTGDDK
jgi:hypothetical protein